MMRFAISAAMVVAAGTAMAADRTIYVEQTPMYYAEEPNRLSGHVEWHLGVASIRDDWGSESLVTWGGAGRLNWWIDDRWNVQGDVYGEVFRLGGEGVSFNRFGVAGHAYWRDPQSHALGGFVAYSNNFVVNELQVGPQAQVYFDNLTLYGQAYYTRWSFPGNDSVDGWGARGVARYFVHDNLRFDGELGYARISEGGESVSVTTAAAQGMYRFDGTPFSVFGRYQYSRLSGFWDGSANMHQGKIGLRGTFGADTLKAEDRQGATMDTPSSLPIFFFGL